MKHRSKMLNEQSLENYEPSEPKPRKRNKKDNEKKEEKKTILIDKKTGDEVNDETISDNRSTNPSSVTLS